MITDLATELNALTTYPSVNDLHDLATKLKAYSQEDITTSLLPVLTNLLLVEDIKRLMTGFLPSTMVKPIITAPIAPDAPNYPTPTLPDAAA